MDNKIKYAIGGVAVIGIIAYLYNKKKKDDALKITTMADASVVNSEPIITTEDMTPTLLDEGMVVMPDGSIVDGSLIAVETNPFSMTNTPIRLPNEQMLTSPFDFIKDVNVATPTTGIRFDGGFDYADGCGFSVDPVLGF